MRAQLVGDEAADRLAQRLVLVGEGRVGGHPPATVLHGAARARHRDRWPAPRRRAARSTPTSTRSRRATCRTRSRSCASCRSSEEPIFYAPAIDYYVVTRYEDVEAIFLDHETFSAGGRAAAARRPEPRRPARSSWAAATARRPRWSASTRPSTRACAATPRAPSRRAAWPRWRAPSAPPCTTCSTRSIPADAVRPRRLADLPAAGDDRLHPHRRAARGLRAAQALVRLSRRTDLRARAARRAGRARAEHRRLPRLPARAGGRARRAPHRRPHERADRHPRRGPRGASRSTRSPRSASR